MRLLVCIAMLIAGTATSTASDRGTASERAACTPDVFRLCASQIPDVSAIVGCLKREKAHLSNACRLVMSGEDHKLATRSLAAGLEWCNFDEEPGAVDEVWRAWCGGGSSSPGSSPSSAH